MRPTRVDERVVARAASESRHASTVGLISERLEEGDVETYTPPSRVTNLHGFADLWSATR